METLLYQTTEFELPHEEDAPDVVTHLLPGALTHTGTSAKGGVTRSIPSLEWPRYSRTSLQ